MTAPVFATYIVTNKHHGALYTGHTDDLYGRVEQHIDGSFPGFSRKYGCKHLMWFEEFGTRDEAFRRERRIKDWRHAWKIELFEKDNPHWIDIHHCAYWPLPSHPDLAHYCDQAYAFAMDPGFRRDERDLGKAGLRKAEPIFPSSAPLGHLLPKEKGWLSSGKD